MAGATMLPAAQADSSLAIADHSVAPASPALAEVGLTLASMLPNPGSGRRNSTGRFSSMLELTGTSDKRSKSAPRARNHGTQVSNGNKKAGQKALRSKADAALPLQTLRRSERKANQETADAIAATNAANTLIQLAHVTEEQNVTAALSSMSSPTKLNAADMVDKACVNGVMPRKPRQQQRRHTVYKAEAVQTADSAEPAPQGQAATAAAPTMSRLMRACALLDKPTKTKDAVTTSAISFNDAWQNANAAEMMYQSAQTAAKSHRQYSSADVLPAGFKPCRTNAETKAYVAGVTAKVVSDHQVVEPKIAAVFKQHAGLHAKITNETLQNMKSVTGEPFSLRAGTNQDLQAWLLKRREPKPVSTHGPEPAPLSSPPRISTYAEPYPEPENVPTKAAFQSVYWASIRARDLAQPTALLPRGNMHPRRPRHTEAETSEMEGLVQCVCADPIRQDSEYTEY